MRWSGAKNGDWRCRRAFAWLPVKIEREWLWLEHYWKLEHLSVFWQLHALSADAPILLPPTQCHWCKLNLRKYQIKDQRGQEVEVCTECKAEIELKKQQAALAEGDEG